MNPNQRGLHNIILYMSKVHRKLAPSIAEGLEIKKNNMTWRQWVVLVCSRWTTLIGLAVPHYLEVCALAQAPTLGAHSCLRQHSLAHKLNHRGSVTPFVHFPKPLIPMPHYFWPPYDRPWLRLALLVGGIFDVHILYQQLLRSGHGDVLKIHRATCCPACTWPWPCGDFICTMQLIKAWQSKCHGLMCAHLVNFMGRFYWSPHHAFVIIISVPLFASTPQFLFFQFRCLDTSNSACKKRLYRGFVPWWWGRTSRSKGRNQHVSTLLPHMSWNWEASMLHNRVYLAIRNKQVVIQSGPFTTCLS